MDDARDVAIYIRNVAMASARSSVIMMRRCAEWNISIVNFIWKMNYDANWLLMRAKALSTLWRLFVYSYYIYRASRLFSVAMRIIELSVELADWALALRSRLPQTPSPTVDDCASAELPALSSTRVAALVALSIRGSGGSSSSREEQVCKGE